MKQNTWLLLPVHHFWEGTLVYKWDSSGVSVWVHRFMSFQSFKTLKLVPRFSISNLLFYPNQIGLV